MDVYNNLSPVLRRKLIYSLGIGGILLLLSLLWVSTVWAGGPLIPLNTFPSWVSGDSDQTFTLAWGDVDTDGDLDLAVGRVADYAAMYNAYDQTFVGIYLNERGVLRPTLGQTITVSGQPANLAWGDVNGDGALDLVVGTAPNGTIQPDGYVQVYLNTGVALSTTAAQTFLDAAHSVALGDSDGDGDLDLAVGGPGGAGLYLNENAAYSSLAWTSVETDVTGVAWGDSDGDGRLDLVVYGAAAYNEASGEYTTTVRLYHNNGGMLENTPVWRSGEVLSDRSDASSAAWADFDQDGDLDLAVGYRGSKNAVNRLYLNQGGTLETVASWTSSDINETSAVAWGDMNGDGCLDLIVSNDNAGNEVYVNTGGALDPVPAWTSADTDARWAIAPADVDNDGDLDLAIANSGADVLYRNTGTTLARAATWIADDGMSPNDLAWGDMDGDGDLDLAVSGYGEGVYRNEGGRLTQNPFWTADATAEAYSIAWGDVDGDGDLDLAVGIRRYATSGARLYLNEGGALSTTPDWTAGDLNDDPNNGVEAVAWGDMDNDGDLDLAIGYSGGESWPYEYHQVCRVYRNEGGVLSATAVWEMSFGQWGDDSSHIDVAWGDANDDGALDLAVSSNAHGIELYLNRDGVLASEPAWQAADSSHPWSIAWGDGDGDGDLDLAAGNYGQPNKIYRNDNGVLQSTAAWASSDADRTTSIAWVDVNGDGALDLAVGNSGQAKKLYLNEGGTLGTVAGWTSADLNATTSIAWGDVDGDGDLDLAAGDTLKLKLYTNTRDARESLLSLPVVVPGQVGGTDRADFYAGAAILAQPTLPISYTLRAPYAGSIAKMYGYYSLNGGGRWLPAKPTADTQITNLLLSSEEISTTIPIQQPLDAFADTEVPITDYGTITVPLAVTQTGAIVDLDVWIAITHTWDGDLNIRLLSPANESIQLIANRGGDGDNFAHTLFDDEAFTTIGEGAAPFAGRYQPEEALAAFDNDAIAGVWRLIVADIYGGDTGTVSAWGLQATLNTGAVSTYTMMQPAVYRYTWDVQGSGLFGKSDNVVFLLQAIPANYPITNAVAGPYQYGAYTAETMPFRVRGSQVRVLSDTQPIANALVFRQSADMAKLTPYADAYGVPLRTDSQGYLQGRGQIKVSDRLVALKPTTAPIVTTVALDEGFEGAVFPPPGWEQYLYGASDDPGWTLQWGDAYEGAQYAGHYGTDTDGSAYSWLYTPKITVPPGGQLTFWQRDDYAFLDRYWYHSVWIITDEANSVELWSGDTDWEWTQQQIDLSAYGGREVTLIFYYAGDYSDSWYIDDVVVQNSSVDMAPYTLYHTSAAPTLTGVAAYTVTALGVQTLTVSAANPFILFNLDVSLEWDAHKDTAFLNQLKFDLNRASELLYNATNGQAALGEITLYHDKAQWANVDIQLHASNALIPNADVGGMVMAKTTRQITVNPYALPGQSLPYTLTYLPGAVRMGTVWSRYGEAGGMPGEDWPRALLHELGHHLFYLYDDYLGLNDAGILMPVTTCGGSLMSNPYDANEYRTTANWAANCGTTLSARRNGRSDWDTIAGFYPQLSTTAMEGPVALPLDVTKIYEVTPSAGNEPLSGFIFTLTNAYGASLQPGPHAQAILYQGNRLVDLGHPDINQVTAHGARAGDRLCVYELDAQSPRWGCETLTVNDTTLALVTRADWQPEILLTPWSTATVAITVTDVPAGLILVGQVYPNSGSATSPLTLTATGDSYTGTFNLSTPDTQAFVQVWVAEADAETAPRREAVTGYAIGGGATCKNDCPCSTPPCRRVVGDCSDAEENFRPAISPDGQVMLYAPLSTAEGFYTLQKATRLPKSLPWATVVGSGYYVLQSRLAPPLTTTTSIDFRYRRQDVPAGEEDFLALYYWTGSKWTKLPTLRHPGYNEVTAPAQGPGLYVLMSSLEIPLPTVGWNLVSYPVQGTRTVTDAMASIAGYYGLVYGYDSTDAADPWKVYAPDGVPGWVNDLHTLRFGQGYWISATQAITWELKGSSTAAARQSVALLSPPATYYGRVLASPTFIPTTGMPVTAYVNGQPCGSGSTLAVDGVIVYHINVGYTPAAGMCGAPGQAVTFRVGSTVMATTAAWNNDDVWELPLAVLASSPTISAIEDQVTQVSTAITATFTISDADSPLDSLWLYAESSNLALVRGELSGTLMLGGGISFGGSGMSRIVTITPTAGLTGTTLITLTVSDGVLTDSDSFILTVVQEPPPVQNVAYMPLVLKNW